MPSPSPTSRGFPTTTRSNRRAVLRQLLRSEEPSVRWTARVRVLGEPRSSDRIRRLERFVRDSERSRRILSQLHATYRPGTSRSVYYYWQGLHWALASLADCGYPPRDPRLSPAIDRVLRLWSDERYHRTYVARTRKQGYGRPAVPVIEGRARRCASQQGNALRAATQLGSSDPRLSTLADLLSKWQWPDGGWNCDRDPKADTSSFAETLTPMRGLAAYGAATGDENARRAAIRAAEVFLTRRMFRRRRDGKVISPEFTLLHYPLYWHYDILGGLRGIGDVGLLGDPRCAEGLDWLEEKELPGGGWPAEAKYYRVSPRFEANAEFVDWGGASRGKPNEWVTANALGVLREAGRFAL